jgi:hypothetical protein
VPGMWCDAALFRAVRRIVVVSRDRIAVTLGTGDHGLGLALSHSLAAAAWAVRTRRSVAIRVAISHS